MTQEEIIEEDNLSRNNDQQFRIRKQLEIMLECARKIDNLTAETTYSSITEIGGLCMEWEDGIIKALNVCVGFDEYATERLNELATHETKPNQHNNKE